MTKTRIPLAKKTELGLPQGIPCIRRTMDPIDLTGSQNWGLQWGPDISRGQRLGDRWSKAFVCRCPVKIC